MSNQNKKNWTNPIRSYFRKNSEASDTNSAENTSGYGYLLLIEAVYFGQSIGDTNQVSIRRGGSILVHEALGSVKQLCKDKSHDPISTGGSYTLIHVKGSHKDLIEIKQQITTKLSISDPTEDNDYSDFSRISFLMADLRLEEELCELSSQNFSNCRKQLTNDIRHQQGSQLSIHGKNLILDANEKEKEKEKEKLTYCEIDNVRPANKTIYMKDHHRENAETTQKQVSAYTKQRHHYGSKKKRDYILTAIKDKNDKTSKPIDYKDIAFTNDLIELSNYPSTLDKPKDHIHINNKVAVLYFDGNSMQKAQDDLNKNEISKFDDQFKDRKQDFLISIIEEFKNDPSLYEEFKNEKDPWGRHGKKALKIELLMWGGDEIMLAVPSWAGFTVLSLFYKAMQGLKASDKSPTEITFAAGLLIASAKTPIKNMCKIAVDLAEEVKDFTRTENAFLPMLLESIDYPNESLNDFWARRYRPLKSPKINQADAHLGSLITPMDPPTKDSLLNVEIFNKKLSENQLNTPLRKQILNLLHIQLNERQEVTWNEKIQQWASTEGVNTELDEAIKCFSILSKKSLTDKNTNELEKNSRLKTQEESYETNYEVIQQLQAITLCYEFKRYIHLLAQATDEDQIKESDNEH